MSLKNILIKKGFNKMENSLLKEKEENKKKNNKAE